MRTKRAAAENLNDRLLNLEQQNGDVPDSAAQSQTWQCAGAVHVAACTTTASAVVDFAANDKELSSCHSRSSAVERTYRLEGLSGAIAEPESVSIATPELTAQKLLGRVSASYADGPEVSVLWASCAVTPPSVDYDGEKFLAVTPSAKFTAE